jgi:tripartite-type tricarboxylate transporter receptor subunit TctC
VHNDFTGVLQEPEVRERISAMGADLVGNSPEQFAAFMRDESAKWAAVVKEASIKAE